MEYKVGDLVELLSFFDRASTGVFGIVVAILKDNKTVYDYGYPIGCEQHTYYRVHWYDFPDLPGSPVYPEDMILIKGVDD